MLSIVQTFALVHLNLAMQCFSGLFRELFGSTEDLPEPDSLPLPMGLPVVHSPLDGPSPYRRETILIVENLAGTDKENSDVDDEGNVPRKHAAVKRGLEAADTAPEAAGSAPAAEPAAPPASSASWTADAPVDAAPGSYTGAAAKRRHNRKRNPAAHEDWKQRKQQRSCH